MSTLSLDPRFASGQAGLALRQLNHHIARRGLGEPFFLFINVIDSHYPYQSPPNYRFAFGARKGLAQKLFRTSELALLAGGATVDPAAIVPLYDATILYVDAMIGELVKWLLVNGSYDDSMIVVTSDHGEHLGEEGRFSHQLSMEEELLRVPLIIKYPKNRNAGTVDDDPHVSTVDLYETILAAAGIESDRSSSGQDLGDPGITRRDHAVAEYYHSASYLQLLRDKNPSFDVEAHSGPSRVVYAHGYKLTFRDGDLTRVEGGKGAAISPALRDRVTEWMKTYRKTVVGPQKPGPVLDDDFVERLRAMGYVE
jgi:membrane-anchored protein YejM (alkaline phosphatase superfamily)